MCRADCMQTSHLNENFKQKKCSNTKIARKQKKENHMGRERTKKANDL